MIPAESLRVRVFSTLLAVAATPTLCACGSRAPARAPETAASPLLGRDLPAFRRPALDGTLVDSAALRGEVVVLELFAENCVPCRTSLPAAERAHLERPSARFVGISEDDDAAGAARMAALYGLSFPVIHDAGRVLAGRLRVSELPVTVIADARGIVRWVGTRAHETEELVQVIDQIARTRD